MKKSILKVVAIFLIAFWGVAVNAQTEQNDNEEHEMHIKIVKIVNGVETVVDTVITGGGDFNPVNLHQLTDLDINFDGEEGKVIVKTIEIEDSEFDNASPFNSTTMSDHKIKKVIVDEDGNVKLGTSENGEEIVFHPYKGQPGTAPKVFMKKLNVIDGGINCGDENISITEGENGEKIITVTSKDGKVIRETIIGEESGISHINLNDEDVHIIEGNGVTKKMILKNIGEGKDIFENTEIDEEGNIISFTSTGSENMKTEVIIISRFIMLEELEDDDIKTLTENGVSAKSLKNELAVEELTCYPNPSEGEFNIRFSLANQGDTEIKIFDMQGKNIYTEELKNFSGVYDKKTDISGSKPGVYFLQVKQGENVINKKMVVK